MTLTDDKSVWLIEEDKDIWEHSNGLNPRKSHHVENSFIIISHFHQRRKDISKWSLFIVRIMTFLWKYFSPNNNYTIIYPKQKLEKIGQNLLAPPRDQRQQQSHYWTETQYYATLATSRQPSGEKAQIGLFFVENKAQLLSCTRLLHWCEKNQLSSSQFWQEKNALKHCQLKIFAAGYLQSLKSNPWVCNLVLLSWTLFSSFTTQKHHHDSRGPKTIFHHLITSASIEFWSIQSCHCHVLKHDKNDDKSTRENIHLLIVIKVKSCLTSNIVQGL